MCVITSFVAAAAAIGTAMSTATFLNTSLIGGVTIPDDEE